MHNGVLDMQLIVGRVNSKATARFQMKDLIPIIPSILHEQLRNSQYYAPKSQSLVIQADGSRKQSDNVDQCFKILRDLILAAGKIVVRGETSPEQKARVKQLYVRHRTVVSHGLVNKEMLISFMLGKQPEMRSASGRRVRIARRRARETGARAPQMIN
jgi:hypothetical protein